MYIRKRALVTMKRHCRRQYKKGDWFDCTKRRNSNIHNVKQMQCEIVFFMKVRSVQITMLTCENISYPEPCTAVPSSSTLAITSLRFLLLALVL